MVTRLSLVLALIGSLLFAASASAGGRDANNDRIPDRWEKRHGLSLKVKQTKRDQDADGLKNHAEWRAKTDPRRADSDDDGIDDSDENAGAVTAFADGVLTITLFAGGEQLTAKVTDETEVECGCDDGSVATKSDDDDPDGDDDEDRGRHVGDEDEDEGEDHGHHGDGHHGDRDDDGDDCASDALAVGALVEEAELKLGAAGKVWREIELR